MPLTHIKIKNTKHRDKTFKLPDSHGLVLVIHKNGSKYWRLEYRFNGKRKTISFGSYGKEGKHPDISISVARLKAADAKKLLAKGIDPREARKNKYDADNNADSFEYITTLWQQKNTDWSEGYRKDVLSRLTTYVYPSVGKMPISKIENQDLTKFIDKTQTKGMSPRTIRKIWSYCVNIFKLGIARGYCDRNIALDIEANLPKISKKTEHRKALKNNEQIHLFLNALDDYNGSYITVQALKLLILTTTRAQETYASVWSEIDLESKLWIIPKERMKMERDHHIPLSTQAIDILTSLKIVTGHKNHLFPNQQDPTGHMSENTLNVAIKRMGFDATAHGMRTVFSSLANEFGFNPDAIEVQLSHSEKDQSRKPYNQASYIDERTAMLQIWADYLDELKLDYKADLPKVRITMVRA